MDERAFLETSSYSQVVFNDVPQSYPPNKSVICTYTITGALEPDSRDWIGVFKVGWNSTQQYFNYVWVEPRPSEHVGPQQVLFKESYLPKDDGEFYQFCYVDSAAHVKGASTPFCFQDPVESSLDFTPEKDLLVITTQEQVEEMEKQKEDLVKEIKDLKERNEMLKEELDERRLEIDGLKEQAEKMEKEKEDLVKENEDLKETKQILKEELDERLLEICRLRSKLEEHKSKEYEESPLSDIQIFSATDEEKYERALQKILQLKEERAKLREQLELQNAEILRLNTSLKEKEQRFCKSQDQNKLLQVDVQTSKKDNKRLQMEIQELKKKILEDKRAEDDAFEISKSEQEAQEKSTVQIQALLAQLTEAQEQRRRETRNCKDANIRAEAAELEVKRLKQQIEEMNCTPSEDKDEKPTEIQVQLQQAQDKIYEMAETSRSDRQKLEEKDEEIKQLRRRLFDYQVASVSGPLASYENTEALADHIYDTVDEHTENPAQTDTQTLVCKRCHECFPGISEAELAQHEQSHKVCPFCLLNCDDWQQGEFEDHVYSH